MEMPKLINNITALKDEISGLDDFELICLLIIK